MGSTSQWAVTVGSAVGVGALTIAAATTAWATTPPSTPSTVPHHGSHPQFARPLSGTVSAATSTSFTLAESGGATVTVDTPSSTRYSETGTRTAPGGVRDGQRVEVVPTGGTSSTATTVTASRVVIVLAQVGGTVGTVTSGTFTVSNPGGLVTTVHTDGTTAYTKDGASASGVTAGERVTAYGTPDTSNPSLLDAEFVDAFVAPASSGPNHPGRSAGGFFGFDLSGTVSAATSTSFTLAESGGATVTVDTPSSTRYSETGTRTAPGGVRDGQRVEVVPTGGTSSTATTVTASRVVIVLAQVGGTVGTVTSGTFTVSNPGGLVTTVHTDGTTVYTKDGASASGVTAGERVTAYGTPDTSNPSQLDAEFVDVRSVRSGGRRQGGSAPGGFAGGFGIGGFGSGGSGTGGTGAPGGTPPAGGFALSNFVVSGKVTSVTGDDIAVTPTIGTAKTVVVSSTTRYLGTGSSNGLAAITSGATVTALGTTSSGVLDATFVFIGTLPSFLPGGRGGPATGAAGAGTRPGGGGTPTSGTWPTGTWPGAGTHGPSTSTSSSTPTPSTPGGPWGDRGGTTAGGSGPPAHGAGGSSPGGTGVWN